MFTPVNTAERFLQFDFTGLWLGCQVRDPGHSIPLKSGSALTGFLCGAFGRVFGGLWLFPEVLLPLITVAVVGSGCDHV